MSNKQLYLPSGTMTHYQPRHQTTQPELDRMLIALTLSLHHPQFSIVTFCAMLRLLFTNTGQIAVNIQCTNDFSCQRGKDFEKCINLTGLSFESNTFCWYARRPGKTGGSNHGVSE